MDESALVDETSSTQHKGGPLNEDYHENLNLQKERFERLYRRLINKPYLFHKIFPYIGLVTALFLLIILPLQTFRAIVREEDRPDEVAFTSAAVFVLLTLILSTRLIYSHLSNWYMPDVQKYV